MDGLNVVFEPRTFAAIVAEEEPEIRIGIDDLPADDVLLPTSRLPQLLRFEQQPLRLAPRFLGANAPRYIFVHNDRAGDAPSRVVNRRGVILDGFVLAPEGDDV